MVAERYSIKDPSLAGSGWRKIEWAERRMNVLRKIRKKFEVEKPLKGITIGAALHVEAKTAVLALTLAKGGAKIYLAACNPLSTQDDVAAALVDAGINVFAKKGLTVEEYYKNIEEVASANPDIVVDDGGDLTAYLHMNKPEIAERVLGGTEETTTGVLRLRAMERDGVLKYPVIAVNNARTKFLFDNRYGTGQSTIDGLLRATNILLAGKTVVVAGYGWCGRGIAMRLRGMGADVIVTEVDPVRALEARMDGFRVMRMIDAVKEADIVITATGNINVVRKEHFEVMKDGCILANAGHFDVEINKRDLEKLSVSRREVRDYVEEYTLKDGRRIYLLAEGRLVNLAIGDGHPIEVMDMSFSLQALSVQYLKENHSKLEPKVYDVPREIDEFVALSKLETMGIRIDSLTDEQKAYLSSWTHGT